MFGLEAAVADDDEEEAHEEGVVEPEGEVPRRHDHRPEQHHLSLPEAVAVVE